MLLYLLSRQLSSGQSSRQTIIGSSPVTCPTTSYTLRAKVTPCITVCDRAFVRRTISSTTASLLSAAFTLNPKSCDVTRFRPHHHRTHLKSPAWQSSRPERCCPVARRQAQAHYARYSLRCQAGWRQPTGSPLAWLYWLQPPASACPSVLRWLPCRA